MICAPLHIAMGRHILKIDLLGRASIYGVQPEVVNRKLGLASHYLLLV